MLKGLEERFARYEKGAWQKVVYVILSNKILQTTENLFECEVTLPHTEFSTKRTTVYTPGNENYIRSNLQQ